MITVTLFPCVFTDGARIIGELSNALQLPVYTDEMILQEVAENSGVSVCRLESILFGRPGSAKRRRFEKEMTVNRVRDAVAEVLLSSTKWIYYGLFSALVPAEQRGVLRLLVVADEQCRMQRAVRRERVSERAARKMIRNHDERAVAWTSFLYDGKPCDPVFYDAVITYGCQDLLDVAAYMYMLYEERGLATVREDLFTAPRNMKLAAGVENALLAKGLRAEVKAWGGKVEISVAASLHCFSWLTSELVDLINTIDGLRTFRLREVASALLESGRQVKVCFSVEHHMAGGELTIAGAY